MISIETQYFSVNRILLLAVGLWPYHRTKFVRFHVLLFFSILTSFIVFQFTTFVNAELTLNLIINVLSSSLCFICFTLSYGSFYINAPSVKCLLEQLQLICNELTDENEIAIIDQCASNVKRLTTIISLFCMCIVFAVIFEPFWLRILGVFLFINESRSHRKLYIMTEYFIDQEKYFYLILLHMNTAICIGVIVITSTVTIVLACLKCACGMFRIASYRIEQAMMISELKNISLVNDLMIYKKIIYAVDIHRKAMQFTEFLSSSFEILFFLLIGCAVICMSLNLYGVASFKNDLMELVQPLGRIFGILLIMFIANYSGQEITDHNNHVYFTVYKVHWYKAPLYIQKLLLFLLQKSTKTFGLNIYGLYVPSLDGFAAMATTSISYFTFIYSTQQ